MKLKLVRIKDEVPGVRSFIFSPQEPLSWKAGQFLHYTLHHEPTDERGSDRWFTVASAPYEKEVMITTRLAPEKGSSFKSALAALKEGEDIEISDVDGEFTVEDPAQEYVFIAGGIGITPFHAILKEADHAGLTLKVNLLYANRDENIPYKAELEAFAQKNPSLKINYLTGRVDEAAIRQLVPDLQKPFFYLSGPAPMVMSLAEVVKQMGVPQEHIKLDDFPGYPAD